MNLTRSMHESIAHLADLPGSEALPSPHRSSLRALEVRGLATRKTNAVPVLTAAGRKIADSMEIRPVVMVGSVR